MLLISFWILIDTKTNPIFFSKRFGKNKKLFMMPKFRTMEKKTPQIPTHLLKDSKKYLTISGILLRKSSLDELPQLFSILIGKMSFVGPRPALFNQNDLIDLRQKKKINALLPGLTGWAQVHGRDDVSIIKKVELDHYYLKNKSFTLDLCVILLTIKKVIKMKDISH